MPGIPSELMQGSDEESSMHMKRMIFITDSMSAAELDSDGKLFVQVGQDAQPSGLSWRVARVARGSGTSVREVEELLCQYQMMANMAKQAGGKNGWCVHPTHEFTSVLIVSTFTGCKLRKKCKQQLVVEAEV